MDKTLDNLSVKEHLDVLHFCTILAIEGKLENDAETETFFDNELIAKEQVCDFIRTFMLQADCSLEPKN